MSNKVNCILLVDDNKTDNFFHERVIRKNDAAETIIAKNSAFEALDYLRSGATWPDLIFLDVNMPGMNGWDFITEYKKLHTVQKCLIVVMTADFDDPGVKAREVVMDLLSAFKPKPLTKEMLDDVIAKWQAATDYARIS